MIKNRPSYKRIYQYELAEEITGKSKETIKKYINRQGITLAEAVRRYLE